jgi:hypothetical protein
MCGEKAFSLSFNNKNEWAKSLPHGLWAAKKRGRPEGGKAKCEDWNVLAESGDAFFYWVASTCAGISAFKNINESLKCL